jgi:hypothetical protein
MIHSCKFKRNILCTCILIVQCTYSTEQCTHNTEQCTKYYTTLVSQMKATRIHEMLLYEGDTYGCDIMICM